VLALFGPAQTPCRASATNESGTLHEPSTRTKYAHDDLARIASANCGTAASQTFSYDPFGNISKSGSPYTFQPTYNSATNRFSSIPGASVSYDANGNVLADGSHTYAWNVHGRPTTIDGVTVTNDALDRMVERNSSGSISQVVYAPSGSKLALMSGQSLLFAFVPLPGSVVAEYHGGGVSYYRHPDWLGSARLISTTGGTMYADTAYAPFGEPYAQAGTADISFTGQNADTVYTDYDFLYREYSIQGRWTSPDPAGLAAVDPTNPQSWNRYAYVESNPLNFVDPSGLGPCGSDAIVQTYNRYWFGEGWGPWLLTGSFLAVSCGDRGPERLGPRGGGGGGGGSSSGFWNSLKNIARKVGNYIPLVCSGGVYNNAGVGTSGPVSVAVSPHFQQADFGLSQGKGYATYSEGVFAEISGGEVIQGGVGQAHTYGYGQSLANSKTTETFLFAGVGAGTPLAGANASAFYATPSSFGISLSGNLLAFQGGVGGYVNVSSVTSCFGF
jgi:RHS repeat-associated protein